MKNELSQSKRPHFNLGSRRCFYFMIYKRSNVLFDACSQSSNHGLNPFVLASSIQNGSIPFEDSDDEADHHDSRTRWHSGVESWH